ncbi:HEAT repeat protein [Anatilimnocola aggregata]|uniref:HEAT repeat protein n=1 Tax=Anatilimnocola aggregata TaxID=2528021 RepID=A0A517Y5D2_9BACT|nr:HEAT repeat domain-containing protein [Anatilimnocola aggregata]QDU25448.1 HEAT repeat protein [Anatilimnocola aggregata]
MAGIVSTLNYLAETENEAAVPVLLAALRAPQRHLQERSLRTLLHRTSVAAELEVLTRWHELSDRMRSLVAEKPGWLSGVIHQGLNSQTDQLVRNACEAALATRDYDQIPSLAAAAIDAKNVCNRRAAEVALLLAEMLFDELHAPRDYRVRRDPQLQRANLMPALERTADSVDRHQKLPLIEALLLLAERDTATVKRILQSPRDPSFPFVAKVLQRSSRTGVIRLLLSYLDDPHAPRSALEILARRRDLQFIRQLLRKIGNQPVQVVRNNLHRIDDLPWLADSGAVFAALSATEQPAAINLVTEANLPASQALQLLSLALQDGCAAGRRMAAAGLAKFQGNEADEIAWQALDDEDPLVRAQAVARMGTSATPTAIPRLLEMLDSPHQSEREAAAQCLHDYNFERYLQSFDTMAPEARLATGWLVMKVDTTATAQLTAELQAPVRARRTRALQIAVTLQLVPELFDAIKLLLNDEDHYTRLDAVRTLANCDLHESQQALRRMLLDHSPLVAQAAEEALARFAERSPAPPELLTGKVRHSEDDMPTDTLAPSAAGA